MSVRKRTWITSKGDERTAWFVDYRDGAGARRAKQFSRKKDADAFRDRASHEVREGIHVADRDTITIKRAGELWIESGKAAGLERTTIDQRRQHVALHITPFIGSLKLSKLTMPAVVAFHGKLRDAGRKPTMIKKVTTSLCGILGNAQMNGLVAQNVVKNMPRGATGTRYKKRLEIGIDIPTPQEMSALIAAIPPRWKPLLLTAIFSGMRASELRGLPWRDVDLALGKIHVRQRADTYKKIGMPKSAAGQRTIPVPPIVINTLREWKLACPRGELDLTFPNSVGGVLRYDTIIKGALMPAIMQAGLTVLRTDEQDNEVVEVKYTGLHTLRHFFASWCINRKADGGRELPAKQVQQLLGHSSITMTLDVYGHLFPSTDDSAELEAATALLLHAT